MTSLAMIWCTNVIDLWCHKTLDPSLLVWEVSYGTAPYFASSLHFGMASCWHDSGEDAELQYRLFIESSSTEMMSINFFCCCSNPTFWLKRKQDRSKVETACVNGMCKCFLLWHAICELVYCTGLVKDLAELPLPVCNCIFRIVLHFPSIYVGWLNQGK